MSSAESQLVHLAESQAGLLSRRQALAAGVTDRVIDRRVRDGLWYRESRGIYRLAGTTPPGESAALAACLKLQGAVVSHESAARLHGFSFVPPGTSAVSVRRSTTHKYEDARVHESTDLEQADCEERGPIVVTRPVRTMIDLAAILRPDRMSRLLDAALTSRTVDLDDLHTRHLQLARKGKPGVALLRSLLEDRGVDYVASESVLESRFRELVGKSGLPEPEVQASLPWRPSTAERVDFLYREQRLIVECDGRRWHTRDRDFERDRRRDNEAMLAGWRVLRLTYRQLFGDEAAVISMLRAALTSVAA